MLIYCPKCQQGYDVGESLIPEEGRKLRCSGCGEVFRFGRDGETAVVKMPERRPVAEVLNEKTVEEAEASPADETVLTKTTDISTAEEPAEMTEEKAVAADNEKSAAPEVKASEEREPESEAAETAESGNDIDEPVDINDIFLRLSEQTEKLFEKEKKLTLRERLWLKFKTLTGWNVRFKLKYILFFLLVIAAVSLYNNRYDATRKFPWTARLYGLFGIEAQILGEGLEFQNVDWVFYDEEDAPRLEIKGFINNITRRSLKIPTVRVEMLDDNTNLLKSQNQQPEQDILKARSRMPLSIVVTKPSPTTKYVFLTFVEND